MEALNKTRMETPIALAKQVFDPVLISFVYQIKSFRKIQVNMGGFVPNSFYMTEKPDTANKKSLEISRGSKEHLEYPVKEAGSVLK